MRAAATSRVEVLRRPGTSGGTGVTGSSGTTDANRFHRDIGHNRHDRTTGLLRRQPGAILLPKARIRAPSTRPVFELTPTGLVPMHRRANNPGAGGCRRWHHGDCCSSDELTPLPTSRCPATRPKKCRSMALASPRRRRVPPRSSADHLERQSDHRPSVHLCGGHKNFKARGYDCSGLVSFALHGGGC